MAIERPASRRRRAPLLAVPHRRFWSAAAGLVAAGGGSRAPNAGRLISILLGGPKRG
jgi:hypothetical protein